MQLFLDTNKENEQKDLQITKIMEGMKKNSCNMDDKTSLLQKSDSSAKCAETLKLC